jgi:hypothetical protein
MIVYSFIYNTSLKSFFQDTNSIFSTTFGRVKGSFNIEIYFTIILKDVFDEIFFFSSSTAMLFAVTDRLRKTLMPIDYIGGGKHQIKC